MKNRDFVKDKIKRYKELKAANLYIKHNMQQVDTLRTLISYSKTEMNIL